MEVIVIICIILIARAVYKSKMNKKYKELEWKVFTDIGIYGWDSIPFIDANVAVKSRQTLEKYDERKFFKENEKALKRAWDVVKSKDAYAKKISEFLNDNPYKNDSKYKSLYKKKMEPQLTQLLNNAGAYRVAVAYISSAGNNLANRTITFSKMDIAKYLNDSTLLMNKSELNKFMKEQAKGELDAKHREYYDKVNHIIDFVNEKKDDFVIKGSKDTVDALMGKLFDRTVNSIKKIKTTDSEEWDIIESFISSIQSDIEKEVFRNTRIIKYYESSDFEKIKETCAAMMSSQREFNEYIEEKVQSISSLLGTRVSRTETETEDEYEYIRPYKKTLTPFTAEVSSQVFASAENSPLEYVIKTFYPNKANYPEQIQKLQLLIEELETLKEAKEIIERYKADYKEYLTDVPEFIMEEDEAGFYSRLGFANISEDTLTVEYKFSYTSGGGMAKRTFTVPMTEETIVELINVLESKLTASAFSKEQRALMTKKLREQIKARDNYTCCICGNSTHVEPNLLLEIDHIIPVAKGGLTKEDNLQTLCWKCNRSKSDKLL
jgi:hypothetical protein